MASRRRKSRPKSIRLCLSRRCGESSPSPIGNMRILLDENIPFGMRRLLADHDVKHGSEESWDGLSNGSLIAVAEAAGYEVLLTADKNLRYQQNLADRALAIVVIGTNHWKTVRRNAHRVVEAL